VDFRTIKHKLLMGFARFMVNFSPPTTYMVFAGDGSARSLCHHIGFCGVRKVLVVTDKQLVRLRVVQKAIAGLKEAGVEFVLFDDVTPDPTYMVINAGKVKYQASGCDGLLAVGGGSSIDAAKVIGIAVTHPKHPEEYVGFGKAKEEIPPLFAIPTTAGTGSEATMGAVISNNDTKEKGIISGSGLLPRAACIDPGLMTGMPKLITAATGMDALTHAIEAYISKWERGDSREKAARAVKMIFKTLPRVCDDGENIQLRNTMAHAAYMAGQAINQVNVGNVHAIAHQLGARYGTPHGIANAQVLPFALKASMPAASGRLAELASMLGYNGADEFVIAVRALNRKLGIPDKVRGLKAADYDAIIEGALAEADGYPVPHVMNTEEVRAILNQLTQMS
jgi:alcohol dehydrogenase class IV